MERRGSKGIHTRIKFSQHDHPFLNQPPHLSTPISCFILLTVITTTRNYMIYLLILYLPSPTEYQLHESEDLVCLVQ